MEETRDGGGEREIKREKELRLKRLEGNKK
jgi:hypothetical protein